MNNVVNLADWRARRERLTPVAPDWCYLSVFAQVLTYGVTDPAEVALILNVPEDVAAARLHELDELRRRTQAGPVFKWGLPG